MELMMTYCPSYTIKIIITLDDKIKQVIAVILCIKFFVLTKNVKISQESLWKKFNCAYQYKLKRYNIHIIYIYIYIWLYVDDQSSKKSFSLLQYTQFMIKSEQNKIPGSWRKTRRSLVISVCRGGGWRFRISSIIDTK